VTSADQGQLPEDAVTRWVAEQLANAPPLSVHQRRVIRAQLAEPDRAEARSRSPKAS